MKFTAQELIEIASYKLSDMEHDESFSLAQLDAIINAFNFLSNKYDSEQGNFTDHFTNQNE